MGCQPLVDAMPNHPKHRHVRAAAVRASAAAIVTFNLSSSQTAMPEPLTVAAIRPDELLLDHLGLAPGTVISALHQQVERYLRPPRPADPARSPRSKWGDRVRSGGTSPPATSTAVSPCSHGRGGPRRRHSNEDHLCPNSRDTGGRRTTMAERRSASAPMSAGFLDEGGVRGGRPRSRSGPAGPW